MEPAVQDKVVEAFPAVAFNPDGADGAIAEIANVTFVVALPEVDPVPVIVIVLDEACVGVPEITPVEEFRESPVGSDPVVTEYETVPVKFDEEILEEFVIAEFTVPEIV